MMPERRPPTRPPQNRRIQDSQLTALDEFLRVMDQENKDKFASLGLKMAAVQNEVDTVRDELRARPHLSVVGAAWLERRAAEFPEDAVEQRTAIIAKAAHVMTKLDPLIPTLMDMAQRDIDAKAAIIELARKTAMEKADHEQREHDRAENNAHLQLIIITGLVTIFGGGVLQFLPKVDARAALTMLGLVAVLALLMALFWRRTMAQVRKASPPPTRPPTAPLP